MAAAMGQQHRARIFEMRAAVDPLTNKPYSLRKIAMELGISLAAVEKELYRPANRKLDDGTTAGDGALTGGAPPSLPRGADPAIDDARRRLEAERLSLQELDLRARRIEAEKRLEMATAAGKGGGNDGTYLLLRELAELRRDLTAALTQKPNGPPPPAPLGLSEQLSQLKQGWEIVSSIGGEQKPPSDEMALNIRVALDKLNMEREKESREWELQREERLAAMENDRIRAEAIAEQIKAWGPILQQGAVQWFSERQAAPGEPAQRIAATAPAQRARALAVLPDAPVPAESLGQAEGPCPSCGVGLRLKPTPGMVDQCPKCLMPLAIVGGKIWPKLPDDGGGRVAG